MKVLFLQTKNKAKRIAKFNLFSRLEEIRGHIWASSPDFDF